MKRSDLALAVAAAAGLLLGGVAEAAIKCWTNNEGVRECGNAIPPEYAQQESRTLNQRGMTVEVQERAKTADEAAAERRRKKDEEARLAEERRAEEERRNLDRVLLSTYTTEQEIVMARDRKVTVMEGTVEMTQASINKLRQRLGEYEKRAATLEQNGKPVPEDLRADIATVRGQIDHKQSYLTQKRAEIEALNAEYAGYLARFRELTQGRGGQ